MASAVIGALRVDLGIDTAAFSNGLKQAGSKLSGFGGVLRKAIVPLAAIASGAAIGLGAMVVKTTNAADEMSKAAQKFGLPIEELSRLKYAADLSDVSLEQLGTSVGKLSRNMVEAASGAGPLADAFAAAGIAVQNADGSLRSSSEVLDDLADKFATMPDGAEKTALAMQLMGKSGAEMIPLLNGGADALAKMKGEADRFGQVFTAEMGANAELFNDNMTRLQGALGSLAAKLTAELLPYLAQFSQWLVDNGPRIAQVVGHFVAFTAEVVRTGAAIVTFARDGVIAIRQFGTDLNAVLEAIPAQMMQIGRDIIDGLLAGLKEKWEAVKAWFQGLAEAIPEWVRVKLGIQSPSTVFAEIGTNIMQGLAQGLDREKDGIQSGMDGFADGIASTLVDVLRGATSAREALGNILGGFADKMLTAGIGGLGAAFGIPGFAKGTNFAPGGLARINERGGEIVNLPRGAQVIPHDVSRRMGNGSVDVRVFVDQDGNWQAAVDRRAGAVSAQVVRRMAPVAVADAQRRAG